MKSLPVPAGEPRQPGPRLDAPPLRGPSPEERDAAASALAGLLPEASAAPVTEDDDGRGRRVAAFGAGAQGRGPCPPVHTPSDAQRSREPSPPIRSRRCSAPARLRPVEVIDEDRGPAAPMTGAGRAPGRLAAQHARFVGPEIVFVSGPPVISPSCMAGIRGALSEAVTRPIEVAASRANGAEGGNRSARSMAVCDCPVERPLDLHPLRERSRPRDRRPCAARVQIGAGVPPGALFSRVRGGRPLRAGPSPGAARCGTPCRDARGACPWPPRAAPARRE